MAIKETVSQFNIVEQAKKQGVPLWQSPQFLFVIMGIVIMASTVTSYVLGVRYIEDPQISLLLILGLTMGELVIAFLITQSFERLVEANRLKAEFVSIVSHQLRSPLTNLKWGLDFLMTGERVITKEQSMHLQILKENTARMNELVDDLLTVSRVEQGTMPFQRKEFSFEELLSHVLAEFQSFIQASNIELKIEKERIPPIFNDPSVTRHAMANLLDNAVRYAWGEHGAVPAGRKQKNYIKIRYRIDGSNLRFEIEDNGVGIPKEDQKYIFQKFFRSRNVVRRQTQGSGLGLYIVKSLVEKAGGTIGFTSEENKGSTFWFLLPAVKPAGSA